MKSKKQSENKLLIIGLCIIIIPILLVACFLSYMCLYFANVWFNGGGASILYENNTSNQGIFSSYYKDKIYYYSNELDGINGIYQMDADGKNVTLLIECPDVRKIAVFDDKLYYVGLFKHYLYKKRGDAFKYGIYESSDLKTAQRIAPEIVDVFDAYFFDDDYILISEGYEQWSQIYCDVYFMVNGVVGKGNSEDFIETPFYIYGGKKREYFVKEHVEKPIMFLGRQSLHDESNYPDIPISDNDFGVDYLNGNRIFDSLSRHDVYDAKFLMDTNEVLFYRDNQMYLFDMDSKAITNSFELDFGNGGKDGTDNDICIFGSSDDRIYATMAIYKGFLRPGKRFAVVIDKNSGSFNEILSISTIYGDYLYFDENIIITLEKSAINKYEHNGEEITSSEKLVSIKNKYFAVSASGGWLLLYEGDSDKSGEDNIYHTLLYKINIETGEVIENTVPFDSSQHDEIYVDEEAP